MNAFADSQILNTVVRMVVPMRREFGRQLDVSQFLRDQGYATTVLDEALTSTDSRLRDYAAYVRSRMSGARVASVPPAAPRPVDDAGAGHGMNGAHAPAGGAGGVTAADGANGANGAIGANGAADGREDELRARVLRKYTTGLR